jgi:NADH:ubiquinone oxidoreductase subunit 6 (subunit J)
MNRKSVERHSLSERSFNRICATVWIMTDIFLVFACLVSLEDRLVAGVLLLLLTVLVLAGLVVFWKREIGVFLRVLLWIVSVLVLLFVALSFYAAFFVVKPRMERARMLPTSVEINVSEEKSGADGALFENSQGTPH